MRKEWQCCNTGNGYDSRYLKIVAVLQDVLIDAEHGRMQGVEKGLEHLLNNALEQVGAENSAMHEIRYPDRTTHELDHFRICTTIARLCWRWSRARHCLKELQELRDLVFHHISSYDHPFEQYLRPSATSCRSFMH